jgi:hypothetical protein
VEVVAPRAAENGMKETFSLALKLSAAALIALLNSINSFAPPASDVEHSGRNFDAL